MNTYNTGKDLFIVDNSVSGWTGLRYLEEWTDIAKSLDVATGYFEVGALLALAGKWNKLEKIRILMGDETTFRTRKLIYDAVKEKVIAVVDENLEKSKSENPFLDGVGEIVAALKSGQIECRVYDAGKFHAKAYITHAKMAVVGSQALVGSSNFTKPGLTQNIELNIQVQSAREVTILQEWFDEHWEQGKEVTDAVINIIERHTKEFTPFDVYAKALHELFKTGSFSETEWELAGPERNGSKVFPLLDRYQQEGYKNLLKIAAQHRGAFLCDGVGLGKTFVGLMLLERLVKRDRRRVALLVPKSGREPVWEATIKRHCPELLNGFLPLKILNHTDLTRGKTADIDWPEVMEGIRTQADVVVIDEAHNFRNPGIAGKGDRKPSRYRQLLQMLNGPEGPKQLYLLTATPVNNGIDDFRHMVELFAQGNEAHFAGTLGINSVRGHFVALNRSIRERIAGSSSGDEDVVDVGAEEATLVDDRLFKALVVQRSRAYVRQSQIQQGANAALFPHRDPPAVVAYSIKKTYGRLLEMIDRAFSKRTPLFALPIYNPEAYRLDTAPEPDDPTYAFRRGRQKQVVMLIRTQFLKRFESSIHAFGKSCQRLMLKILAWAEVHAETPAERRRLERWKESHPEITGFFEQLNLLYGDDEEEADEDLIPQEMLEAVEQLPRDEYDIGAMFDDCIDDLNQIADFTRELKQINEKRDDKVQALIKLLKSDPILKEHKCLIFSEFADTVRYLRKSLNAAGIEGVESIDGSFSGNRGSVIRRFAPYYNNSSSGALAQSGEREIRILISTDVLSEGLNLQDATRLINYDLHWNPVRLMQRIGRVDRRMSAAVEQQLVADHPAREKTRGHIKYWNFLPPDDLNGLLTLYSRVTHKVLQISETFGIEGRQLLRPEDHLNALKEFNEAYEGVTTRREEMQLKYQALIAENPGLEQQLEQLPQAIFSGKKIDQSGIRGAFLCYSLPALDTSKNEFTLDAGPVQWFLVDQTGSVVSQEPEQIDPTIASEKETQRFTQTEKQVLHSLREKVDKFIKNGYLKQVAAPINAPKPVLRCWMELN